MSTSQARPFKLAILGASGKLGFATLTSLLDRSYFSPSEIVATTPATSSSAPQWQKLAALGVTVRHTTFDDSSSMKTALQDVEKLFLVSSPRINLDFHDAPQGQGREKDHIAAIEAAKEAGVKHVYYTSLAFGRPSKSGVMRAHIFTEEYLEQKCKGLGWTVIREGLYNESWPLYFGHWNLGVDDRSEVPVAGDSKISWTSIEDLGLATAMVLKADSKDYKGKTFYLSQTGEAKSLNDIAGIVSETLGRTVKVKVVSRKEHEEYYIKEKGMDDGMIKWWAATYDSLRDEECLIKDDTLEKLFAKEGRQPLTVEETVAAMLATSR